MTGGPRHGYSVPYSRRLPPILATLVGAGFFSLYDTDLTCKIIWPEINEHGI